MISKDILKESQMKQRKSVFHVTVVCNPKVGLGKMRVQNSRRLDFWHKIKIRHKIWPLAENIYKMFITSRINLVLNN